MIVISNIDSQRFSYNGIPYYKNFMGIVFGDYIQIVNVYDSKIMLTDGPTKYDQFTVNGSSYGSSALLQNALLPVLYTRSTLGSGGGGSQNIDQTLANGSVALDETLTLDSTPDSTWDILKTVLNPYGIDIYSKEAGVLETIILGLRGTDLSWTDGGATSGIMPRRTGGGFGNIVNGVFSLPEQFVTEELEILASRQWTNAQIYTAKTEAEAYADGLFDTLVGLLDAKETKHKGIVSSAEKTLTNTTSAQAIYDADLDAEANCTYEIFGSADFTGLNAVGSFLSFSMLGTATIDSFSVTVLANKAGNNSVSNISTVTSNLTQITSSSAITTGRILFFGTVRVSGAGTVKPSVAFSSANASMKVSANSKFAFNKTGSNTVTNY